ncbi:YkgJ family cysteine cluster protein [Paraliomyxa miuraensis]|uniref:YkgJ family cysteine cluster protein n=1 Tax=Paraliomyxa miuraensis TaxID=376150 RepID=UPI0022592FB6|nr:YkgJ family cysteine cluster protein [Paraliomyxa miuraensis]MCX4243811.1 YkgJ family cysteine cluster protein [Paraliomyxa miuraensis]
MTGEPQRGDGPARDRLRRHLRLIDDGVRPVVERYAEHVRCGPGCSDCCHQSFAVSPLEGALLREGLDELPAAAQADIRARARAWRPERREPCPVLGDDGRCRLYEHRPRICRKYGIPLWHPDRPHEVRCCPLNFRDMADIDAALILDPQAGWAEDWIRLREQHPEARGLDRPIAEHLREGPA